MSESKNDRTLLKQLQNGSLEALGSLFSRHQQLVFRTALGLTGDPDVAADLLQDVFLRLHRYAHRVDPERPLEPWLYKVTVNQSYTWARRRKWMHPLEDLADWLLRDSHASPTQQVEQREEWRAVEKALAALPLPQRTVVVLYYINDLSQQEISEILDIPGGTVKSRLFYARRSLQKALEVPEDRIGEVLYEFT